MNAYRIPDELMKRAKLYAVENGITMRDLMCQAIGNFVGGESRRAKGPEFASNLHTEDDGAKYGIPSPATDFPSAEMPRPPKPTESRKPLFKKGEKLI
jgi:hypothetical protein